ncbi:MAG: alpha-rhamnosidase [Prevotellaceae bacterium]|nr:alpha-rhamnosidase [Prevotellaceae bacterium]
MLMPATSVMAGVATWIWYPGDYEIWMANNMQNRRTERGTFFPPFWRMDSHYVLVEFSKTVDLKDDEEVEIYAEGRYNVKLDGKLQFGEPEKLNIPAGKHSLNIKVYNQAAAPAIFVRGKTVVSDSSWLVTFEDKEWIDMSGKASDKSGTVFLNVGSWNFNDAQPAPSQLSLPTTPKAAVATERQAQSALVDFGQETFGFLKLHGLKGKGNLSVYYGESREEALDKAGCETLDKLYVDHPQPKDFVMSDSKAFRYASIEVDGTLLFDNVSMLYEYMPEEHRGAFRCNDEEVNRIWDISAYTLQLSTREFFIDGIKRDRWIWSGDAYQSFLMNYYLFFDLPSVARTLYALRGKDPVTSHINTIMDYTFYWFMGIYDYYLFTGDKHLIRQIYPRMESLMSYVLGRRNANGMLEGLDGDWVFVDWAEFAMSKKGELSFEQLLFCRSLEAMSTCAEVAGDKENAAKYAALSQELRQKLFDEFWSKEKNAFVHNRENGRQSEQVTPYANMFAVLLGYLNAEQTQAVKQGVLLNPDALKITTPYMRFYELEALCALGEQKHVLKEMKSYWGGMLKLGATAFWEKYDPRESGAQHLAMYGRPYGRSLCHAWGASPIYLLGKYYMGVQPLKPGYGEFSIKPNLGGLQWMNGKVPVANGSIALYADAKTIKVTADAGQGFLYFSSAKTPKTNIGTIEKTGNNSYRLLISEHKKQYAVSYSMIP